jgi:hypothetical protein
MIHTIELVNLLNIEDLKEIEVSSTESFDTLMQNVLNKYRGINRLEILPVSEKFINLYKVVIELNIITMLGKIDGVITENDCETCLNMIEDIENSLYFFKKKFILSRLDYRYDKTVKERDRIFLFEAYSKLSNKRGFLLKSDSRIIKTPTYSVKKKFKTSVYYKCKSIENTCYDKEQEKLDKGHKIKPFELSVMRYEVRLFTKHLRYCKSKGVKRHISEYFNFEMYKKYMTDRILKFYYIGDYYKITEAKRIINNSGLTNRSKQQLIQFLCKVSRSKNIDSVIIEKQKSNRKNKNELYSREQVKEILIKLEMLNINPILIPKNRNDLKSRIENPLKGLIELIEIKNICA